MKKNNVLGRGIPVSPSLNPALEAEEFHPPKEAGKRRILTISALTFAIAIVVCFVAKFLVMLIDLFTNLFFYGNFSFTHHSPADNTLGWFVIAIPVIGGLIVGVMALYGSKAIRGHGIPEAMEQILTNQSKIKPAITYLKPLSSAIAIGTGGPFGAEGPIIATGGALGSTLGQLIKISHHERKILLAAGATAGMAAIFGSPLAAIFLAIELLLFELSSRSLLPVSIACITGAAGHHLLFEQGPVFHMPDLAYAGNYALAGYTVIGILIGLLSVGVSKSVYLVEEGFEKLPLHWAWWPALGGIAVGVVGYFFPHTLGVGYENISGVLSGTFTLKVVIALCAMKFLSWAIALGSGTSGGTLAPLLTIGSSAGFLGGLLLQHFFPAAGISLPMAALVGMAAMFSGASRALLTSIAFALETTMQSNALLPLLGACLSSYLISYFLMKNNIMTEKIKRRGVHTPEAYEPDLLQKFTLKEIASDDFSVFNSATTVREAKEKLREPGNTVSEFILVTDETDQMTGMLTAAEINMYSDGNTQIGSIAATEMPILAEGTNLRTAVEIMADDDASVIIVKAQNEQNITGIVRLRDIVKVYKHHRDEFLKQAPSISLKRKMIRLMAKTQAKSKRRDD